MSDIETKTWTHGRVSLLCSYWYAHYHPNDLFKWFHEQYPRRILLPMFVDVGATPIYARHNSVGMDTTSAYIISAFPSRVDSILAQDHLRIVRISPSLQFQNIYILKER